VRADSFSFVLCSQPAHRRPLDVSDFSIFRSEARSRFCAGQKATLEEDSLPRLVRSAVLLRCWVCETNGQSSLVRRVAVAIIMCFTTIVCLAFQYGGVQRDWNSGSVIALLVLIPVSVSSPLALLTYLTYYIPDSEQSLTLQFGVLIAWTHFIGPERAMIQLRFFKRRTIIAACGVGFGGWGTMMVAVQMLAIQYQGEWDALVLAYRQRCRLLLRLS
jgi:hypothetical protein